MNSFFIIFFVISFTSFAQERVIPIKNPNNPDVAASCPKKPLRLTNLLITNRSYGQAEKMNEPMDKLLKLNGLWKDTNDGEDLEFANHLSSPTHHDEFFDLTFLSNKDLNCDCLQDAKLKTQCEQTLKGPTPNSPFEGQRRVQPNSGPDVGKRYNTYKTLDVSSLPNDAAISITQRPVEFVINENNRLKMMENQKLYVFIPSVKSTLHSTNPKFSTGIVNPNPDYYTNAYLMDKNSVENFLSKPSIASTDIIKRRESIVINGQKQDIDLPLDIDSFGYTTRNDKEGLRKILISDPGDYGYCITYGPLSGFLKNAPNSNGIELPGNEKSYSRINSYHNSEALNKSTQNEICPMLDWGVLDVITATRGACPFGNGKAIPGGIERCIPESGQVYNTVTKKCECPEGQELDPKTNKCSFKCPDGSYVSDKKSCVDIIQKNIVEIPDDDPSVRACSCDGKTGDVLCYGVKDDSNKEYYYFIDCSRRTEINKFPYDHKYELVNCEEKVELNGASVSCCQDYSKVEGLAQVCSGKVQKDHARDMKVPYTNPANKQAWETIQ